MGTRTDFYVDTGPTAEWIGSLQFGCHPDNLLKDWYGHAALTARTPAAYRAATGQLLFTWAVNGLGATHPPRHGWPWPWNTSHCNDWIVTFADGDTANGPDGDSTGNVDSGVYMTAGGGYTWHRLDPDNPTPPLRCGPSNFAQWLSNPAAAPAVELPVYPGSGDPGDGASRHWWR
jgi:hypothetical protein